MRKTSLPVGYTDNLGYFHCAECTSPGKRHHPVYEDNAAYWGEACDVCRQVVVDEEQRERGPERTGPQGD